MTNFVAAYLMIQIGFALMVCGFIWRFWFLYIASGLCWGIAGIYNMIISHGGFDYVWAFAFFCLAMSILMFFASWWIPRKFMKKGEYTPFTNTENWATENEIKKHDAMWGKPVSEASMKKEKQLEKEARRARGEWINEDD